MLQSFADLRKMAPKEEANNEYNDEETRIQTDCRNLASEDESDRKRVGRPLTGKYVKNGTGASPSTLEKLKRMIRKKRKYKRHPKR